MKQAPAQKRPARKASTGKLQARGTSPALSRERVLAATLDFIDRHGVAALSLRELAKELQVFPTAIYWHVPSRNALISGAVALALAGVSAGLPTEGAWQARLAELFARFRRALRQHPQLAHVVGGELFSNSALDLPMLNYIVLALEEAGFQDAALVDAFNVVVTAMCGFATLELAAAPVEDQEAWARAHEETVAALAEEEHAALARHLGRLSNRAFILRWSDGVQQPMDSSCEAWVDVVLRGLESRAAEQAAASSKASPRAPRSSGH